MEKQNRLFSLPHFTWWDWFLIAGFIIMSLAVSMLPQNSFNALSFTAGVFSILCIIFGCKGNSLNFVCGLIGSAIQGYMALKSGLYANAVLFLLYNVPMQFIGFFQWRKRRLQTEEDGIHTRWMNWWQRVLLVVLSVAAVWTVSLILRGTDDPQPVSDAMAMTAAVGAQLLLTLAFVEQWFMWLVVNGTQLVMWSIAMTRGVPYAPIMMIQYVFYTMNSIYGIILWSRMSKKI